MTDYPARFLACLPFTLIQECPLPNDWSNSRNFSNTPGDPGGATMCGIIQTEYNLYRIKKGLPQQSVHLLTQDEGYDIYYNNYWLPHCPFIPAGLDLDFFDEGVNTGPVEAVKVLQFSMGITVDGAWGPQTLGALQSLQSTDAASKTVTAFTARRAAVYRMFGGFNEFGEDWERRTSEIGAQALKMVGAA